MLLASRHIVGLVSRVNSISGLQYRDDSTILCWELAHNPLPMQASEEYLHWAYQVANLLKDIDPNHMVTVGSAGVGVRSSSNSNDQGSPFGQELSLSSIDFGTFQMWPELWGWHEPALQLEGLDTAVDGASAYLLSQVKVKRPSCSHSSRSLL